MNLHSTPTVLNPGDRVRVANTGRLGTVLDVEGGSIAVRWDMGHESYCPADRIVPLGTPGQEAT